MPLFALDMAGRKGCGSIEGLQNLHAEINPYKVRYIKTRPCSKVCPFFVLRGKDEFSGFQKGKVLAQEACLRGCMEGRKGSPLPEIFMVCFS